MRPHQPIDNNLNGITDKELRVVKKSGVTSFHADLCELSEVSGYFEYSPV